MLAFENAGIYVLVNLDSITSGIGRVRNHGQFSFVIADSEVGFCSMDYKSTQRVFGCHGLVRHLQ
jgi:hypothetical protein